MASTTGKTSHLSQEYVVDSSDEANDEVLDSPTNGQESPSTAEIKNRSDRIDVRSEPRKRPQDSLQERPSKKTTKNHSTQSSSPQRPQSLQKTPTSASESNVNASSPRVSSTNASPPKKRVRRQSSPQVTQSIPARPFKAPSGFSKAAKPILPTDPVADFFDSLDEDTQLWYITAPSSLPMSSLQEIDLQSLQTKTPITSHNGTAYHITEAKPAQKPRLYFSTPSNANYTEATRRITRTLSIESVQDNSTLLADVLNGTWTADVSKRTPRPPPQQPDALLRYRNRPFGTPSEGPTESNGFVVPLGGGIIEPNAQNEEVEVVATPATKKRKKHLTVDEPAQDSQSVASPAVSEKKKRKKEKHKEREKVVMEA
ncbi:MAG: hypothetical protein Q9227_005058 [Pyrenula ochraceoflavens]